MKNQNPILTVGSIALDNIETIKGKREQKDQPNSFHSLRSLQL